MNWLNVALLVVNAVQKVQQTLKGGATKKEKAIDISDTLIETLNSGLGKEVLSNATVVETRSKLIDAIVAFENAVVEAKANSK